MTKCPKLKLGLELCLIVTIVFAFHACENGGKQNSLKTKLSGKSKLDLYENHYQESKVCTIQPNLYQMLVPHLLCIQLKFFHRTALYKK